MSPEEVATAQASLLLAHTLAHDLDAYVSQLDQVQDGARVIGALCKMLARTIAPEDHAEFSQKLLSSVQAGMSRYS